MASSWSVASIGSQLSSFVKSGYASTCVLGVVAVVGAAYVAADFQETFATMRLHVRSVGANGRKRLLQFAAGKALKEQSVQVQENVKTMHDFFVGKTEFSKQFTVGRLDIDFYQHLTNGKYFRKADLARFEIFTTCGIWEAAHFSRFPVVAASTIRHRLELRLHETFTIKTKCVGYDRKSWFIQQVFENQEGNVAAVLLIRLALTRKGDFVEDIFSYLGLSHDNSDGAGFSLQGVDTRDAPEDVCQWFEALMNASARVTGKAVASPL